MTEPDVYKNTETLDHSYIAGGIENNIAILENSLAALLKKKKKKKVSTWLLPDPAVALLGIYLREIKI